MKKKYPVLENDILQSNNPTKKSWIKISFVDFKTSIMLLNNEGNKDVIRQFIMLEKMFNDYSKYVMEFKLTNSESKYKEKLICKERENIELKNKMTILNDIVLKKGNIYKNQIFYVSTTKSYALKNIFKIGGYENKDKLKLGSLNSNTKKQQKNNSLPSSTYMFYNNCERFYNVAVFECHDYFLLEAILCSFLKNFRILNKKKMFKINFEDLIASIYIILGQLEDNVLYFNAVQPKFIDNLVFVKEIKENNEIKTYNTDFYSKTVGLKRDFNIQTQDSVV